MADHEAEKVTWMVEQLSVLDTELLDEEPQGGSSELPAIEGASRERSTIAFPYVDLDSALGLAKMVHDKGGGQCDVDQLAAWMGHETVRSGAFLLKVAAARLFGLVEGDRSRVQLTQLGKDAVDPQRERVAKANAFLCVPLYRRIFDDHKGNQLPPNVGLERKLQTYGVAPKQTDKARQTFQRSAKQAGFFSAGQTRLVAPGAAAPGEAVNQGPELHGYQGKPHPSGSRSAQLPGGGNGGEGQPPALHPAIQGLMQTLPPAGMPWEEEERGIWLNALELVFKLVYRRADSERS